MAEQLDISNIITNNVKEYLVPKNKIYRLDVNIVGMNDYEEDDEEPTFYIGSKKVIIEVIDDEEEYKKIITKLAEEDDHIKRICETYNLNLNVFYDHNTRIAKTLFDKYNYMSKFYFDKLIKQRVLKLDSDWAIILHTYKQLA
jgi:uncharacterized protein YdcH (DUF465 family)